MFRVKNIARYRNKTPCRLCNQAYYALILGAKCVKWLQTVKQHQEMRFKKENFTHFTPISQSAAHSGKEY